MLPDHDHFSESVSPDDAKPFAPVPYHPAEQARGTR
jgi:hypothetical protein